MSHFWRFLRINTSPFLYIGSKIQFRLSTFLMQIEKSSPHEFIAAPKMVHMMARRNYRQGLSFRLSSIDGHSSEIRLKSFIARAKVCWVAFLTFLVTETTLFFEFPLINLWSITNFFINYYYIFSLLYIILNLFFHEIDLN